MASPDMGSPGISVIIPVYNMADYLPDAVKSLCTQTMTDWEAICIDDGSTDGSSDLLDEYAREDPRFRVFHQENCGAAAARNRGMDQARGRFLFFLDPDDWIPDGEVFSDLYEAAVQNGVRICGGSFRQIKGDKMISEWSGLNAPYTFSEDRKYTYAEYQFDYGWVRFLYDRQFLSDNELRIPEYTYFEDPIFFVHVMDRAGEFYALQRPAYCYRTGYKSEALTYPRTLDLVRGFRDILAFARERGYDRLLELDTMRFRTEYAERILRYLHEQRAGELRALIDEINGILFPCGDNRIEYAMYRYLLEKNSARFRKTEETLSGLKNSFSWKIGRAATALPRRIKRFAARFFERN